MVVSNQNYSYITEYLKKIILFCAIIILYYCINIMKYIILSNGSYRVKTIEELSNFEVGRSIRLFLEIFFFNFKPNRLIIDNSIIFKISNYRNHGLKYTIDHRYIKH